LHHKFTSINITLIIVWLSPFFLPLRFFPLRLFANIAHPGEGGKEINFGNPNSLIPINRKHFLPGSPFDRLTLTSSSAFLLISSNHRLIDSAIKVDFTLASPVIDLIVIVGKKSALVGTIKKFIKKLLIGI
jgi:hypothetical protein